MVNKGADKWAIIVSMVAVCLRWIIGLNRWHAYSVLVMAVQTSCVKEIAPYGVSHKSTCTLSKQNRNGNRHMATKKQILVVSREPT